MTWPAPFIVGWLLLGGVLAIASAGEASLAVMTFNIRYANAPDGPNAWNHRKDLLLVSRYPFLRHQALHQRWKIEPL